MDPIESKTNPVEVHRVTFHKYSDLDEKTQRVALECIASINRQTTTTQGRNTWSNYTRLISQRLENPAGKAQHTLFVAQQGNRFIGYVAYYTRSDNLSISTYISNDNEAYCSWTAIDPEYKGKGLAMPLRMKIFEEGSGITSFTGHIKKDNIASIRSIDKLTEQGCKVEWKDAGDQLFCIVTKPPSSSTKPTEPD